jgi:hypothetical protein
MRLFTPRRIVALAALAPALFLFSAVPGCSNQGEGERCGDGIALNNDDCTAPLVCTIISNDIDRCCDPNPSIVHDSRCLRSNNVGSGGSGGSATAGTGGSGGSATAGTGGSAGGSDLGGTGGTTDLGGTGGIDTSTAGMSSGGI